MLLLGVAFLRGLAVAAALAVLLTMVASLTLLPALLGLARARGSTGSALPVAARARRAASGAGPAGPRLVQRRPWPLALAAPALLLTLASPRCRMRLGSSDAGNDPASTTTRRAYDLLAAGLRARVQRPAQVVAVELRAPATGAAALQLRDALRRRARRRARHAGPAEPGAATPPSLTRHPHDLAAGRGDPDLVDRLRDDASRRCERATGAQVTSAAPTAVFDRPRPRAHEQAAAVHRRRRPPVRPAADGGVPLGARPAQGRAHERAVASARRSAWWSPSSSGAGWRGLIGVERTGPIESFLPVMLFAIVFGLSMDYEVFLMSRVHEEWVRTARRARGPSPTGWPPPGA